VDVREGYISDADTDALLGSVRLVLLPYKDATQSGVGALAIGRGVPCVVSRAGSLPELVPESTPTLIVEPNDPEELRKAIIENIDHGEVLRHAVLDNARTRFAWSSTARRWCDELIRLGLQAGDVCGTNSASSIGDRS
jgi:glycosyltransferase involved in cell wall biosynthesis